MKNLFSFLAVISGVLMTITILVQSQGSGLGTTFGGSSGSYRSKRGAERIIYNGTIIFAVIFVVSVILGVLAKR